MLKFPFLFIGILYLSACAIGNNDASYNSQSSNSNTNVVAYANEEDVRLCRGLGFKLQDSLNSCVRARILTKSGMLRGALKSAQADQSKNVE
jgi:hypothetical protein